MAEITDEQSARAWLEEQPHQVQIWFAARCALRAVPGLNSATGREFDRVALETFIALVIAASGGMCKAKEFEQLVLASGLVQMFEAHDDTSSRSEAAGLAAISAVQAITFKPPILPVRGAASCLWRSSISEAAKPNELTYVREALDEAARADRQSIGRWPPLWHEAKTFPARNQPRWENLRKRLAGAPKKWAFWLEWYEAILEGRPLPWDLSFAIATELTEADWEAGPAHVQGRIEEIRARYELRQRIAELEASLEAAVASRHGIGGNNPPEALDGDETERDPLLIIWEPLEDLKREVGKKKPDKTTIRRAAEGFEKLLKAGAAWSVGKLDIAASEFAKLIGAQAGKHGWKVLMAYVVVDSAPLQAVVNAAWKWLQTLIG